MPVIGGSRSHDRLARTLNQSRYRVSKLSMRTPNLADRLSMANAAKKAQLERAKHMAEDPERAQRLKARDEIVAARNRRITEREGARSAAREQEAAELAARQAAEVAAREAERK